MRWEAERQGFGHGRLLSAESSTLPETAAEGSGFPRTHNWRGFLDTLQGIQAEHVFRYVILALNTLARPAALSN